MQTLTAPPLPLAGGVDLAGLAARIYENGASYRFLNGGASVEVRVRFIGGAPALLSSGQFRSTVDLLHSMKVQGGNYGYRS